MTQQCISMICTCGKHRCHGLKKGISDWAARPHIPFPETEYKTEFTKKPAAARIAVTAKQGNIQLPDAPFGDDTIYKSDYINYKMGEKTQAIRPAHLRATYLPPTVPMDGDSIYKTDYARKFADMVKSCKPQYNFQLNQEPFADETTHRVAFRPYDPSVMSHCRMATAKRPDDGLRLPRGRMDTIPETQDRYRRYPFMERMPSFKPKQTGLEMFRGSGDYVPDMSTTYHHDFIPMPIQRRQECRPAPSKYHESGPFAAETIYKTDYKNYPHMGGYKPASCKPAQEWIPPSYGPIDESITKSDYRRWPMGPRMIPPWGKKGQFQPNTEPFCGETIYKDSYQKPPVMERPMQYKGAATTWNPIDSDIPMDGETEYKLRYKRWMLSPTKPIDRTMAYKPPCHKFEGESITKSDYRGFSCPPRKSFRPTKSDMQSGGPMESSTTYKVDYKRYPIETCPAAQLKGKEDPSGRFRLVGEKNGHIYYTAGNALAEESDTLIETY